MRHSKIEFDIVNDVEQLKSLRNDWDLLWNVVEDASSFQSYQYCVNALLIIHSVSRSRLICVIGRKDQQLVFIWPFIVEVQSLIKVARPLGPGACEFASPLVADGYGTLSSEAWHFMKKRMAVDLIVIDYLKENAKLHPLIMADAYEVRPNGSQIAPYASLFNSDLDSFRSGLKSSHLKKHENLRRRLAKQGQIRFEIVPAGDPRCAELIAFMLASKRCWAETVDKHGDWLYRTCYETWLKALYTEVSHTEQYVAFTLYLDDNPIAVKLAAVCQRHVDLIIAGFDINYAKFSPGMRLDEYWVPWCVERKFDIDFGLGDEYYKSFWSRGNFVKTSKCYAPLSFVGNCAIIARQIGFNYLRPQAIRAMAAAFIASKSALFKAGRAEGSSSETQT